MKRFVLKTLLFIIPLLLLLLNYMILSLLREQSGDLGRVGRVFFDKNYHENLNINDTALVSDVDIEYINDSSEIICFGDSFSNLHPYRYQDAIAQLLNKTVYNITYNLRYSPEDAALSFLTYAPQEKMPQIIIIESIERSMIPRLAWLNFNNIPSLDLFYVGPKHSTKPPRKDYDEEILTYYQHLVFNIPQIIISSLDNHYFTLTKNSDRLYSFFEDTLHYSTELQQDAIRNISRLNRLAEQRGVKLFYLAIPNKSSVYANHSVGNHPFFIPLDNPAIFDTMPYAYTPLSFLRQQADDGVLDIYYADDTHWSPKTAKLVGTALAEIIQKQHK